MISELELDRAFATEIEHSPIFQKWILSKTKFAAEADKLRLLSKEQAELKPKKKPENWWRHWWCKLEDGTESETDIFLVFERLDNQQRISLHIEDKPPHGRFTKDQHLNYKKRAEFMKGKPIYMNYIEYATIIITSDSFINQHPTETAHFDSFITYEEIAVFIPLFDLTISR